MKSLSVARRDIGAYFASPAAFIFIGGFLFVNLFIFFWVETFFARNIADVRPLFEWMPVLLVFLSSAVTMRMWSEERRAGTLEFLFTSPVSSLQFVLGKFFACMWLILLALLLTLPIPITVSLLGPLDWGPVIGAYLATLCLAAAYVAIGLFVSARSDNQIVSLMMAVLICSVFYLLGSESFTDLLGSTKLAHWLQFIGTGTRFESITRGVLDARDLYYYASIVGIFLALNVYSLEKLRWAKHRQGGAHGKWRWATILLVVNFAIANVWLYTQNHWRVDITQGRAFSLSEASRAYLQQLQEPLLIRGYFSSKTHPLLAPLGPQLRDLIREYEVAGQGKIKVEFVDPIEDQAIQKEAAEKYGIQPAAFQTADKYQAALVNSYFDVLIEYGDQYQVLGFRDLIDVKMLSETQIDVQLRNPEYDITRSIKRALYAYQSGGDVFAGMRKPVTFHGYISDSGKLPAQLQTLRSEIEPMLAQLVQSAGNNFHVDIADPDENGGEVARKLQEEYGFRPMAASLLDTNTFWFYMVLTDGEQIIQVPLPEDFSSAGVRRGIEAALKRFSTGFLKTVALYTPQATPSVPQLGMQGAGLRFTLLEDHLRQNANVKHTDLKSGQAPDDADLLIVVAPESLDDKQLFAIDQFLMQGGNVVFATSPYQLAPQGGLAVAEHKSGLEDWLKHNGISLEKSLVMDSQNTPFPVPVPRDLGGFMVQELRMIDYPYFVDIREQGMDKSSGLLAGIPQLTMNWSSPIALDETVSANHQVIKLLRSSATSWTSTDTDIQPDFVRYGDAGFAVGDKQSEQLIAVSVEGVFNSYFQGKASPLLAQETKPEGEQAAAEQREEETFKLNRVIDKSPESARILLFASNSFLSDDVINLASSATGNLYTNAIQVLANSVDWALEDRGLLSIRGRDHFSRMLDPVDKEQQQFWEYLNYGLGAVGLLAIYLVLVLGRMRKRAAYRRLMAQGAVGV